MSDELREAVAQAISNAWDSEQRIFEAADAAIALIRAEVLEEAANAVGYLRWQEVDPFDGRTLGQAVVTIRALKDKT